MCYRYLDYYELSVRQQTLDMAPSLYTSDNTRTYISLQPLAASQTTSQDVRDVRDPAEEDQEEVVEEEEEEEEEIQDQEPPRRQPRSNLRRAPSQANMHHTTVPQAITPSQLGSRNGKCHCQPLSHNSPHVNNGKSSTNIEIIVTSSKSPAGFT